MARIAGVAYLKADGIQLPLRGNFTVSPSQVERAMLAGQDGVHGYSEMPRVPFIEGDVSLTADVTVAQLESFVASTVTAELANGKTYVLQGGVTTAAFALNTKDGLTRVRFEGITCTEF